MKKRLKDICYGLKINQEDLLSLADSLDADEKQLYRNWDEPKIDERGNPRYDDKGNILTRPINAPVERLKVVQSLILNHVLYKLYLPPYFFGGIKKKSADLNARYHQGNKFFFLTDMKDFYPSVSFRSVERALRQEGFYPDIAKLITRLCTKEGAIPQGCPTSSYLASLVVYHSCKDLFEKYQSHGLKISIYVDDITFSSSKNFKAIVPEILQSLRSRGLKINFDKTHYCTYNPRVTGILVKNNGICPLPHTFERAKDPLRTEASRNGHLHRIKYIKKISKMKSIEFNS